MVYCLWLNNRANYYERTYGKIQNVLSDIGGLSQTIATIIIFINNFINKYIIILDTESLLSKANISVHEICNKKNQIRIKNPSKNVKKNDEFTCIKNTSNIETNNNNSLEAKENVIKKNKDLTKMKNIENSIYNNDEKNYKYKDTSIVTNKDNEKSNKNKNEKITFWNFLVYKFSFSKKHKNIEPYEKFREKVISVENLIINHLNVHNLLKVNESDINI